MIGRALLKAASWRLVGTAISCVTVGAMSGLWRFALIVGAVETGARARVGVAQKEVSGFVIARVVR